MYAALFRKLTEDIDPESGDISNGRMEDVSCGHRVPRALVARTLDAARDERRTIAKRSTSHVHPCFMR